MALASLDLLTDEDDVQAYDRYDVKVNHVWEEAEFSRLVKDRIMQLHLPLNEARKHEILTKSG